MARPKIVISNSWPSPKNNTEDLLLLMAKSHAKRQISKIAILQFSGYLLLGQSMRGLIIKAFRSSSSQAKVFSVIFNQN